ncbi:Clavaminate synthase-like protein [Neolentinus lepideus HHB14362 ss-1]|uniref:Clavaminate synthase-like protein n=1 Tax=Neolentinus lepideus HHB14362 ss-1 TaxID=1314782 RepID=A0A165UTV2_9AGAM|nr:Clavaminate synthase-like protein [Neolentinus lepideus HHB14362 ss-1]
MSLADAAEKADVSFSKIPIIDLKNISNSDPSVRQALAEEIRDACMNVGFFYVKNHGIPEATLEAALSETKQFFSLPLETKMEIDMRKTPNFKGYNPLFSGTNDLSTGLKDLHEGFEFGWEEIIPKDNDEKRANDGVMAGSNVWPRKQDAPHFREAVLSYYHAAVNLGKSLFPLFARALDLPETFFDDKTRNSAALMRVMHYPPHTPDVDERVQGVGAHTDWECFTLLYQQTDPPIQALQVLNASNQWVDAPPIPGTLVVNLGDQFARWTNDVFKSNVHRATNKSGIERYSIPLFFGTDYDVRLEPIEGCVSAERPPKYEVITAGQYVKERLKATYGH